MICAIVFRSDESIKLIQNNVKRFHDYVSIILTFYGNNLTPQLAVQSKNIQPLTMK